MCYSVKYLKDKLHKYAKHHDIDDAQVPKLFDQFFVNGFNHPDLAVIPDFDPKAIHLFNWGLIPFWVKDASTATKLSNQTLNARSESVFEKPSFRSAIKSRRCLILLDGFYEYHHYKGKTYPYHVKLKDDETMIMAGLWESWELKDEGIKRNTVSILTTGANPMMSRIHNNPKVLERGGARMPLILPDEIALDWIKHEENEKLDKEKLKELMHPYPQEEMEYYTVKALQGKNGTGNTKEAFEYFDYELEELP